MNLKWFFQRRQTEDDIEGRCECCGIRLNLLITVVSSNEIRILAVPCKDHPKDVMILWPKRKDILTDQTKYLTMLDKSSTVGNLVYKYFPDYDHDKKNGEE